MTRLVRLLAWGGWQETDGVSALELNAETEVKRLVNPSMKGFCIVDNPAFAKASAAASARLIKVDMGDDQFQARCYDPYLLPETRCLT
jgi:hypothetical protein